MKINKNPSTHEVRRFTLVWTLVAATMGVLLFVRQHPAAAKALWSASAIVGLSGIAIPILSRSFYRFWMSLAFAINWIITNVLLAFIFLVILTPLALLFKIVGRDSLQLKRRISASESYWQVHDKKGDKSSYRHLY